MRKEELSIKHKTVKLTIRIIKNHVGCIVCNPDEKEVEVYLISNLSREKLQENIKQVKKNYLFEDEFEFIEKLPEDVIKYEYAEIGPEDNIIKLLGLWIYNTNSSFGFRNGYEIIA